MFGNWRLESRQNSQAGKPALRARLTHYPRFLIYLAVCSAAALTAARAQSIYATPYSFTTIAGNPASPGGGQNQLFYPQGLTVDTNGNVYVVDNFENFVRKIAPSGGSWVESSVSSDFNQPTGITIDSSNNLYVTDGGNNALRKLTLTGNNWVVTTIAGNTHAAGGVDGTNGGAQFNYPSGIAVDAAGVLYVADTFSYTIRRVVPMGTNWVVTTIAGTTGSRDTTDGTNGAAKFFLPSAIVVDAATNLYVADAGNNTIRKIKPVGTNWVTTTIAGSAGSPGSADGTNTDAQFSNPSGIALDASGSLYVADTYNNTIRKINHLGTNWVTTTLAGVADNSAGGYTNGVGTNALFATPYGIAVDTAGAVYVGDTFNSTVRRGVVAAVPNVTLGFVGGNLVVSWPGSFGTLQVSTSLSSSNWSNYGGSVSNSNGTNSVTIPATGTNQFFRLSN